MELGSNFSAKLEPFLLMGKSAKGAAAAKLIQDATSASGVFVFSELLELPNIQEVLHSDLRDRINLMSSDSNLSVGEERATREMDIAPTAFRLQELSGLCW
jgi:hypothetical protein